MKAMIRQEGDVFVIHLKGKVDFDSTEPFRSTVLSHLKDQKVVFNLNGLNFVGSNGITPFIETLVELSQSIGAKIHFCHLSSEFQRIFEASSIKELRIFEDETSAKSSFYQVFHNSPEMPQITYDSASTEDVEDIEASIGVESTPDCTSAIND